MSPLRKRDQIRVFLGFIVEKIRGPSSTKTQAEVTLWEPWELDPAFFKALSQWTLDNPDSTLDRFLQRTIKTIEMGKDFLEAIPDGPIPVRGFLKALTHLVRLGASTGRAQREVYEFAKYIVQWVGSIESAFRSKRLGSAAFHLQKEYLKGMRALIDEICTWAVARMEDRRWSIQGMMVEKEIDEFKARIAAARALFMDVATIIIAKRQDMQLEIVEKLISTIHEIKLSQTNILEFLEEQKKEAERRKFLDNIFLHHSTDKTAYDEQGKRPCDDDTRVEILKDIKKWVFDISDNTQRFLWLTGDPGSGKSAITASIARECKDSGVLWAQFFINRNLAGTTNPASYFPSIARQLADRSTKVSLAIFNTLKAKPSLIDNISQDQAGKLFVDSLKAASSTVPTKPVVVVIDGLDETDTDRLKKTAEILAKALVDLPSNVKVFISSRTEDDIRKPFHSTFGKTPEKVKHVHLYTSSESSIQDVSRFLKKGIVQIAQQNDLDVLKWPGKERLNVLCKRAAGLFIWAVTVIGFIETEVKASGKEVLDTILDSLTASDLTDINVLYSTILQIVFRGRPDPWKIIRFRRIVGCLVVLREPLCIGDIALLLDLRNLISDEPVDILNFFIQLRTILISGADAITSQTIPRLHKSFYEFITSESANQVNASAYSIPLRVNTDEANDIVAMQCLSYIISSHFPRSMLSPSSFEVASKPSKNHPETQGLLSNASSLLKYSCDHVHSHKGNEPGVLVSSTSRIQELDKVLQPPQAIGPRSSPDNMNDTHCVTRSPDGRYLAYGSGCVIRLRDIGTGRFIGSTFTGHSGGVLSVAYSPNGKLLVSASHDHTLRLWNVESGQQIEDPLTYHTGAVNSVAFSANGKHVVSGSDDKTVQVWNLISREAMCLRGHIGVVRAIACQQQSTRPQEYIISGSHDKTIRLWQYSEDGLKSSKSFVGHTDIVISVAFAPATPFESMQFISGSLDQSIRLWDADLDACIRVFHGHTSSVWSVSFSSNSEHIISGSLDKTVRLWNRNTGDNIARRLHTEQIRGTACHGRLVALSSDSGVQLWGKGEVSNAATKLIPVCNYDSDSLISVSISPDCESSVTAFSNMNILVRRVKTNAYTPLSAPPAVANTRGGTIIVTFSPDGNKIAVVYLGKFVCLWSMETEQLLTSYVLSNHAARNPAFISFSPNGKHLLAFRTDGTQYTWDADTGTTTADAIGDTRFRASGLGGGTAFGSGTWYPLMNSNFGLCISNDKSLIRRDKNGVVTIIPFAPPPPRSTEKMNGHKQDLSDWKLDATSSPAATSPKSDLKQHQGFLELVEHEDSSNERIIIAVVGSVALGSGVSSFIEKLAGEKVDIDRGPRPRTTGLGIVNVKRRARSDYEVALVHNVGDQHHKESHAERWKTIANWLMNKYKQKTTVAGVLYVHPLYSPTVSLSPFEDMSVVEELCGANATEKIILTTWGGVSEVRDREQEANLRRQWEVMLDQGSNISRWTYTAESAWEVISCFVDIGNERYTTRLKEEMAYMKNQLCETTLGQDLYLALDLLVKAQRQVLHEYRMKIKHYAGDAEGDRALEAFTKTECEKIQRGIAATIDELQALRLPVRQELLSLLSSGPLDQNLKVRESGQKEEDALDLFYPEE